MVPTVFPSPRSSQLAGVFICLCFSACSGLIDVGADFEDEDADSTGGAAGATATAGASGAATAGGEGGRAAGAAGNESDSAGSAGRGDSSSGAGGSGSEESTTECTFGDLSCDESTPRVCTEEQSWVAARPPCAEGCFGGQCTECSGEARRCKDGAVQVCEGGAWRIEELCESVCEAGECKDACTQDWLACNGDVLQACDGEQYVDEADCEFVCQDGGDGQAMCAGECRPDETRCNPDATSEAQTCDAMGQWGESQDCEQGRFCVQGECKPCEPGTTRCGKAGPQECSAAGEWANQGACSDPDPVCVDGSCRPCLPGDTLCDGSDLLVCDDDGSGYGVQETCSGDTPACLEGEGVCGSCTEGDRQCSDNVVQSCNDSGNWDNLTACSGATPKCVGGSCAPCAPGDRRCLDEDTRQVCQSDGNWGGNSSCGADTPECREDIGFNCGCEEGARRCRNQTTPEACENGGWVIQSGCSGAAPICHSDTGECVECESGGDDRCVNGVAETCDEDGNWEGLGTCASSQVNCGNCGIGEPCPNGDDDCATDICVDGTCRVCRPGATSCLNSTTPRLCSSNGSWMDDDSCDAPDVICDEATGQCTSPLDLPGLVSCGSNADSFCAVPDGNMLCCLVKAGAVAPDTVDVYDCTTESECPMGVADNTRRHACDSSDDCAAGETCCYTAYSTGRNTRCADTCEGLSGGGNYEVCTPGGTPCSNGGTCLTDSAALHSYFKALGIGICSNT